MMQTSRGRSQARQTPEPSHQLPSAQQTSPQARVEAQHPSAEQTAPAAQPAPGQVIDDPPDLRVGVLHHVREPRLHIAGF